MIAFSKYHGCGNDFIIIDDLEGKLAQLQAKTVRSLCHRNKGIGADGVVVLCSLPEKKLVMRIFNADGCEANMCGNALRCLTLYLHRKFPQESEFVIHTNFGEHRCQVFDDEIETELKAPKLFNKKPLLFSFAGKEFALHHIDTGVDHGVAFVDEWESFDFTEVARQLRSHPFFGDDGTNVTFAMVNKKGSFFRTYEKGVEGETFCCGTGAAAAAAIGHQFYGLKSNVTFQTLGGDALSCRVIPGGSSYKNLYIKGKASWIFDGILEGFMV